MAEALAIALHAMGAETIAGTSVPVDIGERRTAVKLTLQALAATGNTVVTVQTSGEEAGTYRSVGVFDTVNAPTKLERSFSGLLQWVRLSWTVATSCEFSVLGEAHTLYATTGQIELTEDSLDGFTEYDKAAACISASGEAETYVGTGYVPPLTAWPAEFTRQVGLIAGWNLIQKRGTRADGADELIKSGRDGAISWLSKVASGKLAPPGLVDSTPETFEASAYTVSDTPR